MNRGETRCRSSKDGETMCGITGFLLKFNSQKNIGANNQAIHGHLQENREKTNNLYGFIMSKIPGRSRKRKYMSYTWTSP